jgi:hypothetical protein
MSACLLSDPLQQCLEKSFIFVLSISTSSAKNCSVGNGNVLLDFFGGGDSNIKVGLQVIVEKMKICSYLRVGKCPYPWDVS